MTRSTSLPSVLNVRLDRELAGELGRIARASGRTQSDVARTLLEYGVDVWRKLESDELARPFRPEPGEDPRAD
jgi:predicted transcriptional regulator